MLRYLGFVLLVVAVAAVWTIAMPPPAVRQPLAFNHAKHGTMACATCHRGAETGTRAGLPQGEVCLNCHATPPAVAGAEAVWAGLEANPAIDWIRLTRVPDHVSFSHRRHVALGRLACASCHGDVGEHARPPSRAARRLDMEACLSCHQQERASQDCAACHR